MSINRSKSSSYFNTYTGVFKKKKKNRRDRWKRYHFTSFRSRSGSNEGTGSEETFRLFPALAQTLMVMMHDLTELMACELWKAHYPMNTEIIGETTVSKLMWCWSKKSIKKINRRRTQSWSRRRQRKRKQTNEEEKKRKQQQKCNLLKLKNWKINLEEKEWMNITDL